MKKKSYFMTLLAMLMVSMMSVGFVSCGDDDDPAPDAVSVTPPIVNFGSDGGSQFVSVTSNHSWTVTGVPSWLTVSPLSGNGNGTISFSANANTERNGRQCVLSIVAGTATASISISQSGVVAPTQVTITNNSTYTLNRFRVVFLNSRNETLVDQDFGTLSPGRSVYADIPTAAKEYYMATYLNSKWYFSPNYDIAYTTLTLSTAEVGGWSTNSSANRQ